MIYECVEPRELKIDIREMSARFGTPVGVLPKDAEGIIESVLCAAKPAYVAVHAKISRQNDRIFVENIATDSRALFEVCRESDECILVVATLGVGVDRLILRTSSISPYDSFVADAVADALIEALCDHAEEKLAAGLVTRGRFSPGYADLELSFGKEIIRLTDAERLLGIKQSDSGLMIPKKSVNAIIAIRKNENG